MISKDSPLQYDFQSQNNLNVLNKSKKNYSKSMKRDLPKPETFLSKQTSHSHLKAPRTIHRSFTLNQPFQTNLRNLDANKKDLKSEYQQVLNNSRKFAAEKSSVANNRSKKSSILSHTRSEQLFLGTQTLKPNFGKKQEEKSVIVNSNILYTNLPTKNRKTHAKKDSTYSIDERVFHNRDNKFRSLSGNPYHLPQPLSIKPDAVSKKFQVSTPNLHASCIPQTKNDFKPKKNLLVHSKIDTTNQKILTRSVTRPNNFYSKASNKICKLNSKSAMRKKNYHQSSLSPIPSARKIIFNPAKKVAKQSPFEVKINPKNFEKIKNSKIKIEDSELRHLSGKKIILKKENAMKNNQQRNLKINSKKKSTKNNILYGKSNFQTTSRQKIGFKPTFQLSKSGFKPSSQYQRSKTFAFSNKPKNTFSNNKKQKITNLRPQNVYKPRTLFKKSDGFRGKNSKASVSHLIYQSSFVPHSFTPTRGFKSHN